jgi:hypothetical protein
VHDTPASDPESADVGSGVDWAAHAVPFHTSASGPELELLSWMPTASQAPAAGHDTPLSTVATAPAGAGTVCRVHTEPFQVAANAVSPL